jgi:uroporphyrinogen-III decarboxylase
MPAGGFYFDTIVRQPPIDDAALDPQDNLEEFQYVTEDDLAYFRAEAIRLHEETDKAILADFGGTAFGDISLVPAPFMKNPRGIRDITEWYISTITRQDYIHAIFERQCEIALANLERIHDAVGELVHVVFLTGTDFGMQTGLLASPEVYRKLYMPFHRELNDWVHQHTQWKTFNHSCGSVAALIPDFIEAGFDVLNPVQTSAAGMDPRELKRRFGSQITFWGGGIDTQSILPFGTPDEVRAQVKERIEIFSPNGGFVFNTIHNVQAGIPRENLLALYQAVTDFR